jgi:hypothetical protein
MPVSIVLRYKDGVWAVDSGKDGEDDSQKNVLTWMVSRAGAFDSVFVCSFSLFIRYMRVVNFDLRIT